MNETLVALLLLGACHRDAADELQWNPQRTTEVVVASHHVPIPAGWRNTAEAKTADVPHGEHGMVMITPESLRAHALRTNIVLGAVPAPAGAASQSCDTHLAGFAQSTGGSVSAVVSQSAGSVRVCRGEITSTTTRMRGVVAFEGDQEIVALFSRATSEGNEKLAEETAIWNGVLAALGIPAAK